MTLLDAYALIALIWDESAADEVEKLLRRGDCGASVVNVAETVDISLRVLGGELGNVRDVLSPLFLEDLALFEPDEADAWRAADLRARYYDRDDRPLSLADCFLLAQASNGKAIATSDPAVAEVARSERIEVVALPDSSGQRP